ncbi:MAG TPA: cyclomaltodextrinase C-terminal domain-containing protein, partial [Puia sp.]|nr:cyclomaltodextrinase C-terminal domain-containing protein [Puia sp.]
RYNKQQTIMCMLNMDTVSRSVDFKDYAERTGSFSTATDVLSGKVTELHEAMDIPARKMIILELKKSEGKK